MSHLRTYEPTLRAEAALSERDMVVGGKVAVLWGGQGLTKDAFAAKIVEICDGPFVQVRFQGYGEAWDRWYSPGDLHVEDINDNKENNKCPKTTTKTTTKTRVRRWASSQ